MEVHDKSGGSYNINNQIRFEASMLQSDLCDYSDAYIVVEGSITVERAENRDEYSRNLASKKNAPFTSCVLKTNNALIDN